MAKRRKSEGDILSFCRRFPDEAACLSQIFDCKYGDHTPCPRCHELGRWGFITGTKKYFHSCRKHVSPLKETPFYRGNMSLTACFYGMLLFASCSNGVRTSFLRRQIGIAPKSAHRLCNLIRLQMSAYDRPKKLGGQDRYVQVDEVLLRHIRAAGVDHLLSTKVMGISCEGKVITGLIADRCRSTLHHNITRWVEPGSIIITDDWSAYDGLEKFGYRHISVNHSRGFFNHQGYSTCEIDSYWATLRRCMRGYHQVAAQNLWLYLAEIECRYNWRKDQTALFEHLISNWPAITQNSREKLEKNFDWRFT